MWSENDYPDEMRTLDPRTRSRAINMANDLLDEGYGEKEAISKAIIRAREEQREKGRPAAGKS